MRFVVTCLAVALVPSLAGAQVIALHPENPHWFVWRGKTTALVTSAEHYGAVLNLDFDYREYLATMEKEGMNYTRIFSGSYVEPPGAFGIRHNTLAPAPGRFLAPWARSEEPGYGGGGNRFDLDRFSPEYLDRLKDFLAVADKHGVVVELTLFCSTYSDKQWAVHPFHPANNVQRLQVPAWRKLHTLDNGPAMTYQENLVRWLVTELGGFDNLFYEIQNEPWPDNHVMGEVINPYLTDNAKWPNAVEVTTADSVAWQARIARLIAQTERPLPKKHLIAQNIANFRLAVGREDFAPEASILNFHYAYPEAAEWNDGWNRVIGCDETGFAGSGDDVYRREAWRFLMSGGGLFNGLDYSFAVGHETGDLPGPNGPGGGGKTLRKQLRLLREFLDRFDLAKMRPDKAIVDHAAGCAAYAMSDGQTQFAIYLIGRGEGELRLNAPAGKYRLEWIDPRDDKTIRSDEVQSDGRIVLQMPPFQGEAAVQCTPTAPRSAGPTRLR